MRMHRIWPAIFLSLTAQAGANEPLALKVTHQAKAQRSLLLELVDWHCIRTSEKQVSVDGTVKNISGISIAHPFARIEVLDKDGQKIESGDKPLQEPLNPEDHSDFSGVVRVDRVPVSCSIDFVDEDGTYLRWRPSA